MSDPSQVPGPRPARLSRRLAAMVYDSLLLLGLSFAYGGIFAVWIPGAFGQRPEVGELAIEGPALVLFQLGWVAMMVGFFLYFWRRGGQTLGMRAWRLRVQQPNGHPLTYRQSLLRCLLAPLSLGLFGLGYLWCLLDPRGQTAHDRLTGTEVVVLPKENRRRN